MTDMYRNQWNAPVFLKALLLTVIIQLCLNYEVPKILETHTKMRNFLLSNTFCLNSLTCIFSHFSTWHKHIPEAW